jgi:erythrose-4-phosphate dehydrogenase
VIRIAINGYGRIGRSVLRALYESEARNSVQVVAINELADSKTIAHLTRYDSTHGRFSGTVSVDDNQMVVNGDSIAIIHQPNIDQLPWAELKVDVVLECSGTFSDRETAEQHITSGAKRVLFSQPAEPTVDATIVYGINQDSLSGDETIISSASCSTNCVVPVIKVLNDQFGIEAGVITTIHSAMNDQPVIDAYHDTDLRKTRAAMQSIIPVDTGLALGIDRLLPELTGRFQAQAMRVPTVNVSAIDLSVLLNSKVDTKMINDALHQASLGALSGVLGYTEDAVVSQDFIGETQTSVFDAAAGIALNDKFVKVVSWYDNEIGYSNKVLDLAAHIAK